MVQYSLEFISILYYMDAERNSHNSSNRMNLIIEM